MTSRSRNGIRKGMLKGEEEKGMERKHIYLDRKLINEKINRKERSNKKLEENNTGKWKAEERRR